MPGSRRVPSPDLGEEEKTISEGDIITPVEIPQCVECGAGAITDDFDQPSLASFPNDNYCVMSKNRSWWWCRKARKLVHIIP